MKQDVFTGKMFHRLFWPSLWASVGLAFSDMADALVVGWRMGETGLAAIGMTLPLFMVINLFMHGLGIGGSVHYAQLLGAGKREEAVDSFVRVLRLALVVSCLLALAVNLFPHAALSLLGAGAADEALYRQTETYARLIALGAPVFFLNYILNYYLRADGQQKRASAGFLAGTLVDIGLNLVLVLLLNLGTAGAAMATIAGSATATAAYLPGLLGRKGSLYIKRVRSGWGEALACLRTGLSSSVQYIYQLIFLLIATRTLLSCFGQTGVAVFDMVQNASYLILYLYDAAAKALQPLAGTFHGERNREAAGRSLRLAVSWGLGLGVLAAALVSLFPRWVCSAFGLSGTEVLSMGALALRLYCLSSVFAGVGTLLEAYYQSVEREKDAFVLATLAAGPVVDLSHHGSAVAGRLCALAPPSPGQGRTLFSPARFPPPDPQQHRGAGKPFSGCGGFLRDVGGHAPAALSGGADGGGNRRGDHLQGLCLSAGRIYPADAYRVRGRRISAACAGQCRRL